MKTLALQKQRTSETNQSNSAKKKKSRSSSRADAININVTSIPEKKIVLSKKASLRDVDKKLKEIQTKTTEGITSIVKKRQESSKMMGTKKDGSFKIANKGPKTSDHQVPNISDKKGYDNPLKRQKNVKEGIIQKKWAEAEEKKQEDSLMLQQGNISLVKQTALIGGKKKEEVKLPDMDTENFQFDHKVTAMDRFLEFQADVIERGMEQNQASLSRHGGSVSRLSQQTSKMSSKSNQK